MKVLSGYCVLYVGRVRLLDQADFTMLKNYRGGKYEWHLLKNNMIFPLPSFGSSIILTLYKNQPGKQRAWQFLQQLFARNSVGFWLEFKQKNKSAEDFPDPFSNPD